MAASPNTHEATTVTQNSWLSPQPPTRTPRRRRLMRQMGQRNLLLLQEEANPLWQREGSLAQRLSMDDDDNEEAR